MLRRNQGADFAKSVPYYGKPELGQTTPMPSFAVFSLFLILAASGGGVAAAQERLPEEDINLTRKTFYHWDVTCGEFPTTDEAGTEQVCELRHAASSNEPNGPLMSIALQVTDGRSDVALSLIVPFGLLVSEPVFLTVPEGPSTGFPFQTCLPRGCVAAGSITRAVVDKITANTSAELTMSSFRGVPLTTSFSLLGFSDAWTFVQLNVGAIQPQVLADDAGAVVKARIGTGSRTEPQANTMEIDEQPGQPGTGPRPDLPFTQIGLFRVHENAQAALLKIQRAGSVGEIRETQLKGVNFWRVLVGPARDVGESNQMLVLARSLGFKDAYHVRD
jgi:invasion protein IalB